ncbi:four helix bundle protein [Candidatus Berkelbacteria bacterium CG_4_9_14_3_um_filter_39_23]|uniref:Four helix bundle protein n=2 Tax=Candidatus Berkelbacteria TaxID=1618330 RepID=A0A2M7CHG1_9BACT|nr:MAG: four helix bundle protein [Candidatus Berkelbacteria bacterium CG11_big_fil_rev_8_21_14_0_20_40_23]PIV25070.1 MAG: four helix bundle protein [Candidatus Berkelbacteria bacterium CG03_land_8_20_14_0_80_40_36]PIX30578.1 MAG: four helix bundle protein [Candidatus Berkelbacteria bacterium CG_4_8_14_3_um_filter_39_27]PIZ28743.1 MAG: four helix bundle protein [Candidatus Berkelbacteria bacterium CG_4_10_14_0_8_um_filter_39_42]PJB51634.1 MAG: four helix bundle protein [Candidatus Berkelbacteri
MKDTRNKTQDTDTLQTPNSKQEHTTVFDLEDSITRFAIQVIKLCKKLDRNPINDRIVSQAVSSSGSVGANYREANDALGKKDFAHKLKISRKECKEAIHWLILIGEANEQSTGEIAELINEGQEIRNILSAIIKKCW